MHTFSGRIDCKAETRDYIYLFAFKRDDMSEAYRLAGGVRIIVDLGTAADLLRRGRT